MKNSIDDANKALDLEISKIHAGLMKTCWGQEKRALIEVVRSIDIACVANMLSGANNRSETAAWAHYAMTGAALAMHPLLKHLSNGSPAGIPWTEASETTQNYFNSYVITCGKLAKLKRCINLARYNLATVRLEDGVLEIVTHWSEPEEAGYDAMLAWRRRRGSQQGSRAIKRRAKRLRERMFRYVDFDPKFLIQYDNDTEIVSHYMHEAELIGSMFFEGEALPPHAVVGGRTFKDWKHACDRALGRILCHIDFTMLLTKKRPDLNPRDVLALAIRREDIEDVWRESGMEENEIAPTLEALSLDPLKVEEWSRSYDSPTSFYIPLDKTFLLTPCFGAISNPYFSLFTHLKKTYRKDWDSNLEWREHKFRMELSEAFSSERFLIPQSGFKIRRDDGSIVTDIDAIIIDKRNGRIGLVQLKWHDIYGLSLSERESRRKNLEKANEWVNKVEAWADGKSSRDVADAFGLSSVTSELSPRIFVIARYAANFSADAPRNKSAYWTSWPELQMARNRCEGADILEELWSSDPAYLTPSPEDQHVRYGFDGLTVDLIVRGTI